MTDEEQMSAINDLCGAVDRTMQQIGFTSVKILMIVSYDNNEGQTECATASSTLCGECLTNMLSSAAHIIQKGINDGRLKDHGTDLREVSDMASSIH